ncbi:phosphatidylinositol 3- and 4-kinase domain-containing protein [Ditylenchus destructor]|nr:phosphatidylinositol 3- and 4-kinase domain-containing protein [Ditylenchus destructor]
MDGMSAENSLREHVKGVIKQIVHDRSNVREMKSASVISNLQSMIIAPPNLTEVKEHWKPLIDDIGQIFSSKTHLELKNGAARCVGLIGFIVADQFDSYVEFVFDKCKTAKREEERASLIRSLQETVVTYGNHGISLSPSRIKVLLEQTKSYLDTNESPVELIPLLEICRLIAVNHPVEFVEHLHDVCDFVIGWFMDHGQPKYVENKCREMFQCFGPIFASEIEEAISFLQSLTDDWFYIVEQLGNPLSTEKPDPISTTIPIMKAFIEIFENSINASNVNAIKTLIAKINDHLEEHVNVAVKLSDSSVPLFCVQLGELILTLNSVMPNDENYTQLRKLVCKALQHRPVSKHSTLTLSKLLAKAVSACKAPEKLLFVELFTGEKSLMSTHPLLTDTDVCAAFGAVLSKMVDIKDLNSLQTIYTTIANDIIQRVNNLQKAFSGVLLNNAKKKEVFLIMLLSALRPLTTAKNSIIVLRGLDPSLFSLLFSCLPIKEPWMVSYFPTCHHMMLNLAHSFSNTHAHFISNSDIFQNSTKSSAFSIEGRTIQIPTEGGPTAKYFGEILPIMTALIVQIGSICDNRRTAVIHWLDGISKMLESMAQETIKSNKAINALQKELLSAFLSCSFDKDAEEMKTFMRIMDRLQTHSIIADYKGSQEFVVQFTSELLRSSEKSNENALRMIWSQLPTNYLLQLSYNESVRRSMTDLEQPSLGKSDMVVFQFNILNDFLMGKGAPSFLLDGNNATEWMVESARRFYMDLVLIDNRRASSIVPKALDMWRFVIAQFALFCIDSKMKTPLGKPVETFTKFENGIRELVSMLNSRTIPNAYKEAVDVDKKVKRRQIVADEDDKKTGEIDRNPVRKLTVTEEYLRVSLLLYMVDSLDKLMFLAGRGSMFNIADIPTSSSQFFHTNRASCEGWIVRVAPLVMSLCFSAGAYGQIVRLIGFIFTDCEKKLEKEKCPKIDVSTTSCICWTIQALVELSAPQAIKGVQRWSEETFGQSFEWMSSAQKLAAGRVEQALHEFSTALSNKENLPSPVVDAIQAMTIRAVRTMRHSTFSRPYCEGVIKLFDEEKSEEKAPNDFCNKAHIDSALALSSWESLNTINGVNFPSTIVKAFPWELKKRTDEIENTFMQIWTEASSNNRYYPARSDFAIAEQELFDVSKALLSMTPDETDLHAKVAVLKLVSNCIEKRVGKENSAGRSKVTNGCANQTAPMDFDTDFLLNNPELDSSNQLSTGQMLVSWMDRLVSAQFTAIPTKRLITSHLRMSKLALKTENIALARHHIQRCQELCSNQNPFQARIPQHPGFVQNTAMPNSSMGYFNGPANMMGFSHYGVGIPPQYPPFMNSVMPPPAAPKLMETDWETLIHSTKLSSLHPSIDGPSVLSQDQSRLGCFTELVDAVSAHIDCQQEFIALNQSMDTNISTLASKVCLRLGKWTTHLAGIEQVILQKQSVFPRIFLDQILRTTQFVRDECNGVEPLAAFQGAFYLVACGMNSATHKAHKVLADWALNQIYAEDCDYGNATEALKISPAERAVLEQIGINFEDDASKKLLSLMSKCTVIDEMKQCVNKTVGREDPQTANALTQAEFTQVWLTAKRRHFKLFEIGLSSSLRYLEGLSALTSFSDQQGYQDPISIKLCCMTILKMLSTHPDWFDRVTVDTSWIERIDCGLWKDTIPQLFAQLGHSNTTVRKIICRILERIGEVYPQAICFPAIVNSQVGSAARGTELQIPDNLIDDQQYLLEKSAASFSWTHNSEPKSLSLIAECCAELVESLKKHHPKMVEDVAEFCIQLHRMCMLPEEKLLFVLSTLDYEMSRRVKQWENEQSNPSFGEKLSESQRVQIFKRKMEATMDMIHQILLDIFESMLSSTMPATNCEKRFNFAFKNQLAESIEKFSVNKMEPSLAWAPLKKLTNDLTQRSTKKSSLCLSTHEISPYLYAMESTSVPIPGHEFKRTSEGIVTLQKMDNTVYVLPTKTRPKKISFRGSDGKQYSFLFKGQEDLHLDERVTQLLRTCNFIFQQKQKRKLGGEWPEYFCSNYTVTPLSARSGLIQWVEGSTPIFQVYRKWKIRQIENQDAKQKHTELQSEHDTKKKPREGERPMDIFYNKLKAVFQDQELSKDELKDRKKWPLSCLERVVKELMVETPNDILAKELWMKCGDSGTWWRVTQRFARSTAVMSVVGSVVGLGDRHLDNVLVNFANGNVTHVDYNVCFEKGRFLRIPESVPFRLTPNIVQALGPTKIEGTYRESCLHVLDVLRCQKGILLSLVNTFVHDPLVDWAATQPAPSPSPTALSLPMILAVYGTDKRSEISIRFIRQILQIRLDEFKDTWKSIGKNLEDAIRKALAVLLRLNKQSAAKFALAPTDKDLGKAKVDAFTDLKKFVTKHHEIMVAIRPFLRALACVDRKVAAFLQLYKEKFSHPFVESHKLLDDENLADFSIPIGHFQQMLSSLREVHDSLLGLHITDSSSSTEDSLDNVATELEFQKPLEDGNIHAKNIARRIRRKLAGYEIIEITHKTLDDSPSEEQPSRCVTETEAMTSSQQADFLINNATDIRNLALMYEGWTSWV